MHYSGFEVTCPDWDLKSALDHVAREMNLHDFMGVLLECPNNSSRYTGVVPLIKFAEAIKLCCGQELTLLQLLKSLKMHEQAVSCLIWAQSRLHFQVVLGVGLAGIPYSKV